MRWRQRSEGRFYKPLNAKNCRRPRKRRERETWKRFSLVPLGGTNLANTSTSDFRPLELPENKFPLFQTIWIVLFVTSVLGNGYKPEQNTGVGHKGAGDFQRNPRARMQWSLTPMQGQGTEKLPEILSLTWDPLFLSVPLLAGFLSISLSARQLLRFP